MDGLTVQGVVERARSSVGSFYARFSGKEELLRYLERRVWTEAEERWSEALRSSGWDELDVEEVVQGVVSLLVRTAARDAARRIAFGGRPGEAPDPPGRPSSAGAAEPGAEEQGGVEAEDARGGAGGGAAGPGGPEAAFHRRVLSDLRTLLVRDEDGVRAPDPELAVELGYWMVVGTLRLIHQPGSPVERVPAERDLASELSRAYRAQIGRTGDAGPAEPKVDFFDVWS